MHRLRHGPRKKTWLARFHDRSSGVMATEAPPPILEAIWGHTPAVAVV
jgi:hypothetical protein